MPKPAPTNSILLPRLSSQREFGIGSFDFFCIKALSGSLYHIQTPSGPNIVPNLPAAVGMVNQEVDAEGVANDILQFVSSDTANTTTNLD